MHRHRLIQLQNLELNTNDFTGTVPATLCNLSQLDTLYLHDLPLLAWSMPPCFATELHSLAARGVRRFQLGTPRRAAADVEPLEPRTARAL